MKKVFIIHGLDSAPNKAWRPWLMRELGKQDIYTCALPMPGGKDPVCEEWVKTIRREVVDDDEIYLVGHSLGVRAVLRYLEQLDGSIEGAVLVSGRFGKPKSDVLHSFYDQALDFDKIKTSSKSFVVIHGDNDPNVPYENGKLLAGNLGCELITIPNGGHLGGKAQCFELPEALKALNDMMK